VNSTPLPKRFINSLFFMLVVYHTFAEKASKKSNFFLFLFFYFSA